jgi:phosphate transport system protein
MRPREHFDHQLGALHTELRALGQMVVAAITQAVDALSRGDSDAARQVIAADPEIDRAQYTLEERVLVVMATQQPMASDLRRLVAAIAIASELERIGDYAKGIAKMVARGVDQSLIQSLDAIHHMAELAIEMLGNALDAFVRQDAVAARRLGEADDRVDKLSKSVRAELLDRMRHEHDSVERAVDLLFVVHNLERIADRTTNIAERIIFMVSGEVIELNP